MKTNAILDRVYGGVSALLALGALSGCGQQAFNITPAENAAIAPGHYTLPAKVDILVAQDDTGSILPIQSEIRNELPTFLSQLDSKNWDYRFTLMPLTKRPGTAGPITQIAPSRYDGNWGALWTPAFPGADQHVGKVDTNLFRTLWPVSGISAPLFNLAVSATTTQRSVEPAFQAISETLQHSQTQQKFLRQDAMLAVIVISNGEDTTGLQTCTKPDGQQYLCEYANGPNAEMSPSNLQARLAALKAAKGYNPSALRVYSIVSPTRSSNCRGSGAYAGSRYEWMATETGGASYNICAANSISHALQGIAARLEYERRAFKTAYLVIAEEPELASIRVYKRPANGAETEIPYGAGNGWVYEGGPKTVYTIQDPVPMLPRTGYVIRLNGDAQLTGDETARVEFTAKGARDSR